MIERDQRIVKSATEAREGVTGHNVRYVLIVSLVGVCSSSGRCGSTFSLDAECALRL
jgi:hypothetical protein